MGSARKSLRKPRAIAAIPWKTRLPAFGVAGFREKLSRDPARFSDAIAKI
jgi:hypothetical protein